MGKSNYKSQSWALRESLKQMEDSLAAGYVQQHMPAQMMQAHDELFLRKKNDDNIIKQILFEMHIEHRVYENRMPVFYYMKFIPESVLIHMAWRNFDLCCKQCNISGSTTDIRMRKLYHHITKSKVVRFGFNKRYLIKVLKYHLEDNYEPEMLKLGKTTKSVREAANIVVEQKDAIHKAVLDMAELYGTSKEVINTINNTTHVFQDFVTDGKIDEIKENFLHASKNILRSTEQDNLKEVYSNLNVASTNILDASTKMKSATENVDVITQDIRAQYASVVDKLKQVPEQVKSTLGSTSFGILNLIIDIVVLVLIGMYTPVWLFIVVIIEKIFKWFNIGIVGTKLTKIGTKLISYFKHILPWMDKETSNESTTEVNYQTEGGIADSIIYSTAALLTAGICYSIGIMTKSKNKMNTVKTIFSTCDNIFRANRAADAVPRMFSKCSELLTKAITLFVGEKYQIEPYAHVLGELKPKVDELIDFVSNNCNDDGHARARTDEEFGRYVTQMKNLSDELLSKFHTGVKDAGQLPALLRMYANKINELYDSVIRSKWAGTWRYDPFCIWFCGAPDSGKSTNAMEVMHELAKVYNVPEPSRIYSRAVATEYWDEYTGQFCTFYDDMGSINGEKMLQEMSELISMKSNLPMQTKMASLNEKGRKFTSNVILVTSNQSYPAPNEVPCREAVWRRRNLTINCFKTKTGVRYNFIPSTNPDNTTYLNTSYSFDQVINVIKITMAEHFNKQIEITNKRGFTTREQFVVPREIGPESLRMGLEEFNSAKSIYAYLYQADILRNTYEPQGDYDMFTEIVNMPKSILVRRKHFTYALLEKLCAGMTAGRLFARIHLTDITLKPIYNEFVQRYPNYKQQWMVIMANHLKPIIDGSYEQTPLFFPELDKHEYTHEQIMDVIPHVYLLNDIVTPIPTLGSNKRFWNEFSQVYQTDEERIWIINYYHYLKYLERREEPIPQLEKEGATPAEAYSVITSFIPPAKEIEVLNWCVPMNTDQFDIAMRQEAPTVIKERYVGLRLKYNRKECVALLARNSIGYLNNYEAEGLGAEDKPYDMGIVDVLFTIKPDKPDEVVLADGMGSELVSQMKYVISFTQLPMSEQVKRLKYYRTHNNTEYKTWKECPIYKKVQEGFLMLKRAANRVLMYVKKFAHEHPIITSLIVLLSCSLVGFTIFWIYRGTYREESGEFNTARPRITTIQARDYKPQGKYQAENGDSTSSYLATYLVPHNLYNIYIPQEDGRYYMQKCLFLKGRYALVTGHLTELLDQDENEVVLEGISNLSLTTFIRHENIFPHPEYDLSLIKFHSMGIRNHRDITGHLSSLSDISKSAKFPSSLVHITPDRIVQNILVNGSRQVETVNYNTKSKRYSFVSGGYTYDMVTDKGMCGSPLVIHDTRWRGKLIGIHTAGTKIKQTASKGFAIPLIKEELKQLYPFLFEEERNGKCPQVLLPSFDPEGSTKIVPPAGYVYYGKSFYNAVPQTKTEIIPSVIHGAVPVETFPAVLTNTDPRNKSGESPLITGLKKYTKSMKEIRSEIIEPAFAELCTVIPSITSTDKNLKWSWDSLINGKDGIEYMDVINMQASPGVPYTFRRPPGSSGRRFMFDQKDDKYYFNESDAAKLCVANTKSRIRALKKNVSTPAVWVHCLKDETLKKAKIENGLTRLFTMANLDLFFVVRALFGQFAAAFFSWKGDFSSISINPHSFEWHDMAKKLLSYGDKIIDGDFKGWDGMLSAQLMHYCNKFIQKWYDKHYPGVDLTIEFDDMVVIFSPMEAKRARRILLYGFIHTVELVFDCLHQKNHGEPSGKPILTSTFNTICNRLLFGCVYIILSIRNNFDYNVNPYSSMVKSFFLGDDNIHAPKLEILDWFNFVTIQDVLFEFDMVYTDARKSGVVVPYVPLAGSVYLKRGFKNLGGYYCGPLDIMSIHNMLNWIRKSDDDEAATRDNIMMAMNETVYYGAEFSASLLETINGRLEKENLQLVSFDYRRAYIDWISGKQLVGIQYKRILF